jgi:hypothetical protein
MRYFSDAVANRTTDLAAAFTPGASLMVAHRFISVLLLPFT